ncbi:hypothetical protein OKW76_00385 [Sphingomonas sp. S1-29]|uniref:hypothetical protein n=1 Tax=Sphingomonas sp. S1-29 TaxID=2991074 RepID=UPI00223FE5C3|nr:hypothetical protein [Sphingomonas sp. S1-29]UZK69582.1 hypothetical protein OKW76_00385 [Sphingomonas sp. S1-29]
MRNHRYDPWEDIYEEISRQQSEPARIMHVITVHLEPQQPVEEITQWLGANCASEANILYVNKLHYWKTNRDVCLTASVEFADEGEAMLFKMRWTQNPSFE